MLELKEHDTIITAYAESAAGPGWANQPIWVIVQDGNGKLRRECIQPDDQTRDMWLLYRISEAVHRQMISLVFDHLKGLKNES